MALRSINRDGSYQVLPTPISILGSAFYFALTGTNWEVRIISNAPNGPDTFFLECADANGAAIAEILQGKPPGGIGVGQDQNNWISGNNGTSNVPQIDYIIGENGDIFTVLSVFDNNKIKIDYPGVYTDGASVSGPQGCYTRGVQVDEINLSIIGEPAWLQMASDVGTLLTVTENTVLSFTEGSGPITIYGEDDTNFFAVSFKKSLERLS